MVVSEMGHQLQAQMGFDHGFELLPEDEVHGLFSVPTLEKTPDCDGMTPARHLTV